MWKQIHRKLRSRSGETLAEVLIALLIISLSSMLLVVMISTAGRIDMATRARDKMFYEELNLAETHTGGTETTGTIKISGGSTDQYIEVTVYGGNGLTSYEKKAPTPVAGGDTP